MWKLKLACALERISKLPFNQINPFYITISGVCDIGFQCFKVELLFVCGDFIRDQVVPDESQLYLIRFGFFIV